ncbi:hypothetical protein C4D60_Mb08t01100 [Musa balbisiana]|uniref:Uncharacterized protein n=1 Tax=Musa balbisiana TaxID=52838 RepID=A0A4S8K0J3_MUSBA|nr:hypothetical protein C4D60_Mb08t01100 [Musa balbisiana]
MVIETIMRVKKRLMEKRRQEAEAAAKPAAARLQCNKGKACRFKRSCFSKEDDAISSAILLLACVVCAPRFHPAGKRTTLKDFVPAGGGGNVSVQEAVDKVKAKVYYKGKGKVVGRRARSGGVLVGGRRGVEVHTFQTKNGAAQIYSSTSDGDTNLRFDALRSMKSTPKREPLPLPEAHSNSYNNNKRIE